ncbi:hypothetical protein CSV77_05880 [Sporosarcina sp. P16b]|uniref:hypothetical protein n=1 Tax=Sporosarcina sp. P16b TaxID=2048261 RepID=UPI000C16802C|nr:hypothetical protein [Sporosarcina sp. P16b]PIC70838.1 hypothetical protein CSV77_05880 [Sporosarcina sp. P16b]
MNADIIAEITKMVMKRLEQEKTPSSSLTESEIKRWNNISTSIQRASGDMVDTQSDLSPLTPEDLRKWNSISEKNSKRQPSGRNSDNIRFHTQY